MKGKMRKKRWVLPRCGFDQVVDLKLTKNKKGKKKKRWRLDKVVYLNDKRFTMRTKKKKRG